MENGEIIVYISNNYKKTFYINLQGKRRNQNIFTINCL